MIEKYPNSLETIDRARAEIASMVAAMRLTPGEMKKQYGHIMYALGYLAALQAHELIYGQTYMELKDELKEAHDAVWAEEGAAKG